MAAEEDLQSSTLAPALPRLLSAMLAGVPAETLAARLARPVALDLVRRADGGLAARERARASRAARHACHGLRLDGGPPQHGLKPLGRRAALALSGAGLRARSSRCAPASLPLALLARLHARWCAHAWEALEAALAAAGRGGGGALGDARAQPRLAQLRPRAPAPGASAPPRALGASAPPPAPGASAPPPAPGAAPPPSPAALHTPAGLARALQGPARGLLRVPSQCLLPTPPRVLRWRGCPALCHAHELLHIQQQRVCVPLRAAAADAVLLRHGSGRAPGAEPVHAQAGELRGAVQGEGGDDVGAQRRGGAQVRAALPVRADQDARQQRGAVGRVQQGVAAGRGRGGQRAEEAALRAAELGPAAVAALQAGARALSLSLQAALACAQKDEPGAAGEGAHALG